MRDAQMIRKTIAIDVWCGIISYMNQHALQRDLSLFDIVRRIKQGFSMSLAQDIQDSKLYSAVLEFAWLSNKFDIQSNQQWHGLVGLVRLKYGFKTGSGKPMDRCGVHLDVRRLFRELNR